MNTFKEEKNDNKLYGLKGLSQFLGISLPVASALKRSKLFPTYLAGKRKYIFNKSEVLEGIKQ